MSDALVMRDDYGRAVRVGRTQEGKPFVSIAEGLTVVMAVFGDGRLAEFTELLDRAAMPGQPGHACIPHVVTDPGAHRRHGCPTCLAEPARAEAPGASGRG